MSFTCHYNVKSIKNRNNFIFGNFLSLMRKYRRGPAAKGAARKRENINVIKLQMTKWKHISDEWLCQAEDRIKVEALSVIKNLSRAER